MKEITSKSDDRCHYLLWIGIPLLIFSLLGAVFIGDKSARKLEDKIEKAAHEKLKAEGINWASVEADGQRIYLTGVALSQRDKESAGILSKQSIGQGGFLIGGVTRVVNNADIARPLSPFVWQATASGGVLTMQGYAPSRKALTEIEMAAQAGSWQNIENELGLASGVEDEARWLDMVKLSLAQLRDLEPGRVILTDTHLQISGAAHDNAKVDDIAATISNLASPYTAESSVEGPYNWVIEKTQTRLNITGLVPDEESRRALNEVISAHYNGTVNDDTGIGGDRGWVRTALLALPQFLQFEVGKLSYSGDGFFIEGRSPESVYTFLSEDLRSNGGNFGIQYDVDVIVPDLDELQGLDLSSSDDTLAAVCQDAFALIMDSNQIYFETGRADISRRSGTTLDKLITVGRRCNNVPLRIEGHTDNVGRRSMNLELSNQRADAVVQYLKDRGYPESRLESKGFGPDSPTASNETPEGRADNRRIEFIVISEETR